MPSPDPPTVMVAADLEGVGPFYTQLTDGDPDFVTFDQPVDREVATKEFQPVS